MNCAFEEDTMSAVLAYGTQAQFDAEAFLRPFGVAHAVVWQAGQRLLKGRVHQDSGFRIPLGEYLTVADLSAGLLSYLQEHAPMCLALQSLPGTCRIDILAPLTLYRDFARSVDLDPVLLQHAAALRIGVSVTACIVQQEE